MLSINKFSSYIQNFNNFQNPQHLAFTSVPDTFEKGISVEFSDKMREKFSEQQLQKISKKYPDYIQKVEDLSSTKLESSNILSSLRSFDFPFNSKKLASKVIEMQDLDGENLESIELSSNRYVENSIDIISKNKNGVKKTTTLDNDLNIRSIQEVSYDVINNQKIEVKKEKDFKQGITSVVKSRVISESELPVPISEVIVTKDYKEISEPSEVKGVFNTKRIYNSGIEEIISSGKVDKKNGIKTVKKDMVSFDGTRTQYEYSDDFQGNKIVDYKITDKNGNVLYKNSEAFEVIDENTFISSKNDKSYEIKYSDDNKKLSIMDRNTKDKTEIDLNMKLFGSKEKLLPALKRVSGDELIKMDKNVNRLFYQPEQTTSCYKPTDKDVTTCGDEYILVHELGHAKDMKDFDTTTFKLKDETQKLLISSNKEILDTYLTEKDLFNKNFSTNQRENIDYFINGTFNYPASRSVKETVAEINAILNTCNDVEKYSLRSEYMQRYFPRTISKLAEIL